MGCLKRIKFTPNHAVMDPTTGQEYWNNRYRENKTGWDIGFPSTPIKTYIDQLKDKSLEILIPGCGNAYEAEYLLGNGFQRITLIDIAPDLTAGLAKKLGTSYGDRVKILTGDFFQLTGKFDMVFEQTFFCALDPALRLAYVQKMQELLAPKGLLVGVLFNRDFDGGPPFGGHLEEYTRLFEPYFHVRKMEPCYNSIDSRKASELFIIMEARAL